MEKKLLLAGIKKAITERIGSDRLKGVFLFGSDLQEVISATYSMQLDIDQIIYFTIADIRDYPKFRSWK